MIDKIKDSAFAESACRQGRVSADRQNSKLKNDLKLILVTNRGFTLVEILVVVMIISLLLTFVTLNLGEARKRGKDGRRKTDLTQIQSALEMYKADNQRYPVANGNPTTELSVLTIDPNIYINTIPIDQNYPLSNYYYSSDGITYNLCAQLERDNDPDLLTYPCSVFGADRCGTGKDCNYSVKNP